jgi:ABC-type nitrate/sulfonate/bicarbonate transport system substrate-binding protein
MLASMPYETFTFLPLYVGYEKGFFTAEGIDLDYCYFLSGGVRGGRRKTVELCVGGSVPFFSGVPTVAMAQLKGWADVKALAASFRRGSSIYARASIRTVADLKGRRVMTGGGSSREEVLYVAKNQGWDVERDLDLSKGDEVARRDAFADPTIDAVCARALYQTYADQHGFRRLEVPGAEWYEGGLCTSQEMIETQPDAVRAAVTGWVRAIEFIRTHRDEAVEIAARNIRWLDLEGAERQYDVISFDPTMTEAGLSWMAGLLGTSTGSTRPVAPDRLADLRFLQEAIASGPYGQ